MAVAGCRKADAIERALVQFDAVTVERGAGGGFIVTLDDAFTGDECGDLDAAVSSALAVAP